MTAVVSFAHGVAQAVAIALILLAGMWALARADRRDGAQ